MRAIGMVSAALVAAVTAALVGPLAAKAAADTGTTGAGSGGGTVTVGAGSGGGTGGGGGWTTGGSGSGGGSGSPWICTYLYLALNNHGGFPPGGPMPGAWYSVTCDDAATGAQVTQTIWITNPPASAPTVDPRVVALQAENSMTLPSPTIYLDPTGTSVVDLPTWLWVAPALWRQYSVTATAGPVSATAVATPVGVSWSTGDGGTEQCGGPGRAYDPALPSAWQSTYCSHTYARTSIGQPSPDGDPDHGRFPISATVEWAVTWTAVGAPGGGSLPSLSTTSTVSLRVIQIQSLIADGGASAPRASSFAVGAGA